MVANLFATFPKERVQAKASARVQQRAKTVVLAVWQSSALFVQDMAHSEFGTFAADMGCVGELNRNAEQQAWLREQKGAFEESTVLSCRVQTLLIHNVRDGLVGEVADELRSAQLRHTSHTTDQLKVFQQREQSLAGMFSAGRGRGRRGLQP